MIILDDFFLKTAKTVKRHKETNGLIVEGNMTEYINKVVYRDVCEDRIRTQWL